VVKRTWLVRGSIAIASTLLTYLALWASGARLAGWFHPGEHRAPTAAHAQPQVWLPSEPAKATETTLALEFPGIKTSIATSPQKLLLMGTILGRNSHEGSAFIGVDARNPQTYLAGAVLANGARLTGIFKEYVVLEQHGQSTRLYLHSRQQPGPSTGIADRMLFVGAPESFKPAQATSSESFTDFIRPTPVYSGTTLTGFEVYPGKYGSVFTQMGLRAGDVVLRVSGQAFSDPSEAMDTFRSLAEGNSLTAEVSRGGHQLEIELDGTLITGYLTRASAAATPTVTVAGTN